MVYVPLSFSRGPSGIISISGLSETQAHNFAVRRELLKIPGISSVEVHDRIISLKVAEGLNYQEPVIEALRKALHGVNFEYETD